MSSKLAAQKKINAGKKNTDGSTSEKTKTNAARNAMPKKNVKPAASLTGDFVVRAREYAMVHAAEIEVPDPDTMSPEPTPEPTLEPTPEPTVVPKPAHNGPVLDEPVQPEPAGAFMPKYVKTVEPEADYTEPAADYMEPAERAPEHMEPVQPEPTPAFVPQNEEPAPGIAAPGPGFVAQELEFAAASHAPAVEAIQSVHMGKTRRKVVLGEQIAIFAAAFFVACATYALIFLR